MTIVVGLRCIDGLVICADRQVSQPNHHKYYEQKIYPTVGDGWLLALGYSGRPGQVKEVHAKVARSDLLLKVNKETGKEREKTVKSLSAMLDKVLTDMGRKKHADLQFDLLIGISTVAEQKPELFTFDGKAMHPADGFTCLGVGDSSLIHYLKDAIYDPSIDLAWGTKVGIYLAEKAKKYIDGCGGETDVLVIRPKGQWAGLSRDEIDDASAKMEGAEAEALRGIIRSALSGPVR